MSLIIKGAFLFLLTYGFILINRMRSEITRL